MVYEVKPKIGFRGAEEKCLVLNNETQMQENQVYDICRSEGEFLLLGKDYIPYRDKTVMEEFAKQNRLFLVETYQHKYF